MSNPIESEALNQIHFDVLERLEEHKTSKEIALELNISPSTVEQRIRKAREVLGATNRRELISRWQDVKNGLGRTLYEPETLPEVSNPPVESINETGAVTERLDGSTVLVPRSTEPSPPGLAQGFLNKRRSPVATIAVILALTAGILILVLIGLSVSVSLSELVRNGSLG